MADGVFKIEKIILAPVSKVWCAITDKDEMKQWYFNLTEFKPETGFEFHFTGGRENGIRYLHNCRITEAEPDKKLTYSWSYEGYAGESFVSFELFPEGNNTRLVLTHTGLDTFPADNPDFDKNNFVAGWTQFIGTSLPAYLELKSDN